MRSNNWRLARFAFVYFNSQASIFLIPSLLEASSYQGIAGIACGSLLSLIVLFAVVYIGKLHPSASFVEFGTQIIGKGLHRIMVFLLLVWCVYYASYDIQNFVIFFGTNYLKGTPPWFIQVIIGLVVIYVVSRGVRTIVYMSDGLFLVILCSTLFIFFFFAQKANFQMLPALVRYFEFPIFFKNTLATFSVITEWVVFLFLAPQFKIGKGTFLTLAVASIGNCTIVMLDWIFTLLNFSPHYAKQIQYPFLEIIRSMINEGLLENSAPFIIGVWTASMFIHCSFLIYVAAKCTAYLTKGKSKAVIIPALVAIAIAIAFYYAYHLSAYQTHYFSFAVVLIWTLIECIPLYYAIAAMIRFRKKPVLK